MREWHEDLRKEPERTQVTWYECGIDEFDWTEGSVALDDLRHWTIKEVLTRRDLFDEGRAMRHCVASYEHSCVSGRSAIWSMGLERNDGRRKPVLTVEVAVGRKLICQVRGKANRLPTEKELEILADGRPGKGWPFTSVSNRADECERSEIVWPPCTQNATFASPAPFASRALVARPWRRPRR